MASTSPAIRFLQCSGKGQFNEERLVPTDKDALTDKIVQLRLSLSAADAVAFGAADFRAAKGTKGKNILLLKNSLRGLDARDVTVRLLLASDGSNNPSNRDAEARLIAPPRIRTVALDSGGAAHPHELAVTLVVERPRRPGASPNRAEQRHTLTVEKADTRTIIAVTSVTVTITKPRGGEKKRACTPPVGAVEPAAPSCKQLEEQVACLEKVSAALLEENAALRNILDADIGGARAELGAVEHIEGLLGALATTGEEQTPPIDFGNLPYDDAAGSDDDDDEEDQMQQFDLAGIGMYCGILY